MPQARGVFMMVAAAAIVFAMLGALRVHVHYLSERHLMFLAMLLAPLAGAGLILVAQAVGSLAPRSQGIPRTLLLTLVPAAVVAGMLAHALRPLHDGKGGYRQVGEKLHAVLRADDYILTDTSWIIHYSEGQGKALDITALDADGFLKLVRDGRPAATYVVLSDSAAGSPRIEPQLRPPIFNEAPWLSQPGAKGTEGVRVFSIARSALERSHRP